MKLVSNGQFDVVEALYVFDPSKGKNIFQKILYKLKEKEKEKKGRFVPVNKIKGEHPSDIYLHYVSFETRDPFIKKFRMALCDKRFLLEPFKSEGIIMESEGTITKYRGHIYDDYENQVETMWRKAKELSRKK